jgi:hypothetical protein
MVLKHSVTSSKFISAKINRVEPRLCETSHKVGKMWNEKGVNVFKTVHTRIFMAL